MHGGRCENRSGSTSLSQSLLTALWEDLRIKARKVAALPHLCREVLCRICSVQILSVLPHSFSRESFCLRAVLLQLTHLLASTRLSQQKVLCSRREAVYKTRVIQTLPLIWLNCKHMQNFKSKLFWKATDRLVINNLKETGNSTGTASYITGQLV